MKGLVVLILILAALVVGEWQYWPAQPPPPYSGNQPGMSKEAISEAGVDVTDSFNLPPLEYFNEVSQRPLFFEGRRPPAPAPDKVADTGKKVDKMSKLSLNLAAVVIVDGERYALIREKAGNTGTKRLKAGDEYGGWVVKEINEDRLIMRQGEHSEPVLLREYKKVLPPKQAPKPKKRAAPKRTAKDVLRKRRQARPPPKRPTK